MKKLLNSALKRFHAFMYPSTDAVLASFQRTVQQLKTVSQRQKDVSRALNEQAAATLTASNKAYQEHIRAANAAARIESLFN